MNTTPNVRRIALVAASLLSASALVACGSQPVSGASGAVPASANRMDAEAHRYLIELGQARAISVASRTPPFTCSETLAATWQRLGHFSDGYERYLLTRPPCA